NADRLMSAIPGASRAVIPSQRGCRQQPAATQQGMEPATAESATERTAKHGETEQRRRTEKSGSTGRPAQQADLALPDWIGNTNASSRDGARVSDPIRQRASLRDARRTALRVTPLLRLSVFGRYL